MVDFFDTASTTEFFFRVFGLYFVAAGLGIMTNLVNVEKMLAEIQDSPMIRFMAGILAFISGVVILSMHNDWSTWQASFVTVFGWAALIKGLLIMALPGITLSMMSAMTKPAFMRLWSLLVIVMGAVMLWFGFAG
jgi:hypothetical protein